eukprot:NODE_1704_length_1435_cov_25.531746_g1538_i0.p1 GENE.NODE_1704_length_1435_cov_25.531746_g1538_i0~~NODE_1704_length_1435_cov_25.531746_g1538_i0.p1  ORF type:complete len:372 (+),score=53.65 NODE_1704_length_1435_cov_25.531746_g1538_i0:157-1272(+)
MATVTGNHRARCQRGGYMVWLVPVLLTASLCLYFDDGLLALSPQRLYHERPQFRDAVFLGHLTPDTDAICSAMAAASFFGGTAARTGPINRETAFVLNYFGVTPPPLVTDISEPAAWALVDFASEAQLHQRVNKSRIALVIDHHKVSEDQIATPGPIHVDIRPWGCTCTILTYLYRQENLVPTRTAAGLMLGAILSDTLNLRSPTTTPHDRSAVAFLRTVAKVSDFAGFVKGMFEAKSSTEGMTAKEIVLQDFKVFTAGNIRYGWGAGETMLPGQLLDRAAELVDAMVEVKREKGLDLCFFSVSDISFDTPPHSTLIAGGDREMLIAGQAFPGDGSRSRSQLGEHVMDIGRLVSRKNDFIPKVSAVLARHQ